MTTQIWAAYGHIESGAIDKTAERCRRHLDIPNYWRRVASSGASKDFRSTQSGRTSALYVLYTLARTTPCDQLMARAPGSRMRPVDER